MRALARLLLAVWGPVMVGGTACADSKADQNRLASAQQALIAWFECVECNDGELDRLLSYRDVIEGALISTLVNGPSPSVRASVEHELRANYRSLPKPRISEKEYVASFSENVDAGYRVRAATALGKLRTQSALEALRREAASTEQRDDVRAACRRALGP